MTDEPTIFRMSDCLVFTIEDLRNFAEGLLPDDRRQSILNHLPACAECETELARLIHNSDLHIKPPLESTFSDTAEFESFKARLQLPSEPEFLIDIGDSIGTFELVGKLGRGGSSTVYDCIDKHMHRRVAVKVLNPRIFDDSSLSRLEREARSLARLNHPGIVKAYEIKPYHFPPYIVMELVAGGPSNNLVKKNPLPSRLAARLVAEVARAVQHAHEHGILHRDIKPSNLLVVQSIDPDKPLPENLTLKVSDFGLARPMGKDSILTSTNAIIGTPAYMSPEQSLGSQNEVGPATDVYSLGVVLYEFLIGRPPLIADNTMQTLRMVNEVEPLSPRLILPVIPRDLDTICLKCLRKNPAERYASAKELADDLDRFLENRPILARPISPLSKLYRWCNRNLALSLALLGILTLVLSLLALSITFAIVQKGLIKKVEAASNLYQQAAKESGLESDSFRNIIFSNLARLSKLSDDLAKVQNHEQALILSQKTREINRQSIDLYMKRPSFQNELKVDFLDIYFRDGLAMRDIGLIDESLEILNKLVERAFQSKPGDDDYLLLVSIGNRTAPVIGRIKLDQQKPDEARSIMLKAWKAFPLQTDQSDHDPMHLIERFGLLTTLLKTLKDPESKPIAAQVSREIESIRNLHEKAMRKKRTNREDNALTDTDRS